MCASSCFFFPNDGFQKIETNNELLQDDFKTSMNKYCSQGSKLVADVLLKASDVYTSILGGGDDDDDDEEEEEEEEEMEVDVDDADLMMDSGAMSSSGGSGSNDSKSSLNGATQTEIEEFKKRFGSSSNRGKSESAVNCIMAEYFKLKSSDSAKFGFSAEPVGDDIFTWEVRLFGFDPKEDAIAKDLVEYKKKHGLDYVQMEMKFTENFPLEPPFIRVVRPRFQFRTGHVTIGGSICMQLLTKSGWSPVNTIESIFVQIRCEIATGGARLDLSNGTAYSEHEAREAYHRVAARYGWDRADGGKGGNFEDH